MHPIFASHPRCETQSANYLVSSEGGEEINPNRTFLPAYLPRVMMATRPTLRNFIVTEVCVAVG